MAKGPAEALKLLPQVITHNAAPRRALDLLVQICINQSWHANANDARDEAEAWEQRFLRRVADEIAECERRGGIVSYAINSSANNHIQGSAFIESGDSDALKEAKRALLRSEDYKLAFRNLSPVQFEALCAGILQELGVENPKITPQTRDEGIDFYGRLSLEVHLRGQRLLPGIERQFSVWLIGQAKHFGDDDVSTLNIRELVGSVFLARTRTYSTRPTERYRDLNLRACDPIFTIFITTTSFSNDAFALLERSGIIGMDGSMVATFLSERNIGLVLGQFSDAEFVAWVDTRGTVG